MSTCIVCCWFFDIDLKKKRKEKLHTQKKIEQTPYWGGQIWNFICLTISIFPLLFRFIFLSHTSTVLMMEWATTIYGVAHIVYHVTQETSKITLAHINFQWLISWEISFFDINYSINSTLTKRVRPPQLTIPTNEEKTIFFLHELKKKLYSFHIFILFLNEKKNNKKNSLKWLLSTEFGCWKSQLCIHQHTCTHATTSFSRNLKKKKQKKRFSMVIRSV